jgi:hypothetical protein
MKEPDALGPAMAGPDESWTGGSSKEETHEDGIVGASAAPHTSCSPTRGRMRSERFDTCERPSIPRPRRWLAVAGLLPIPGPFDEVVLHLVAPAFAGVASRSPGGG